MKTVLLNMDPSNKKAGHTAAYWQRDPNYIWKQKQSDGTLKESRPGARLLKYRDFELQAGDVTGVAQRYDGNCSIKLRNGDCITIDLPRAEVGKLLHMEQYK